MPARPDPLEPPFSAACVPADQPGDASEWLPAPSKGARRLIREHLAGHGIKRFRLAEHVHLGGPRLASQHITWHPAKAAYSCELCPGYIFGTGETTPEQIQLAQLFNQDLQPHLAGLHSDEEREQMTRLYLSGELNRERLAAASEAAYRAAAARSRHAVAARRARLQEWMLKRYAECGYVNGVIDAAESLQHTDPALWLQLVGRPLVASTIRKDYWNPILADRKTAAKQRFERSRTARKV